MWVLALAIVAGAAASDVQQVHIAQAAKTGMSSVTVSWLSNTVGGSVVKYGTTSGSYSSTATGPDGQTYKFQSAYDPKPYESAQIHHVLMSGLALNTRYYYVCGSVSGGFSAENSFTTVGPSLYPQPFSFAMMGDLGQTSDSVNTMQHVIDGKYDFAILSGDLSYADSATKSSASHPCTQTRWDSWGVMIEPLAANVPIMFVPGNHEIEQEGPPPATQTEFLAYQSRFAMPSVASGAQEGNLYYSFDSAGVHFLMLNSYEDFNASSMQYKWMLADLAAVDRTATPWLVASMHAPWYNSNAHHHDEIQETDMRAAMEKVFKDNSVDLVIAGHVHAYERMYNVYNNKTDSTAPLYINIGDGGNREGPAADWLDQPSWSAFREATFGHGELVVYNATHAQWRWHSLNNPEPVVGDQVWMVKKNGAHRTPVAVGYGRSSMQYDGYAQA